MKASDLSQHIQQWVDELAAETDAVRVSQRFQQYVDAMSRFHQYSWSNQLLILLQCPAAQQVAGYHAWLRLKRQVRKGAHGIAILAPVTVRAEDAENLAARQVVTFRTVYVFDVSQTDGEPLPPQPEWRSTERRAALHARLLEFAASAGITVATGSLSGGARGASLGGRIVLIPEAGTKTLIHEIAHELLHHSAVADADKRAREVEAETTAYVVCRRFGIASDASSNYLALWGADAAAIRRRLERVQKAASRIIAAVEVKPATAETDDHEQIEVAGR